MNEYFVELGRRLVAAAGRRGRTISAPTLDPEVALEILELARVAAHTKERRFAPLASFMAGVAAERARAAGAELSPGGVAELVREVRTELEREAGA